MAQNARLQAVNEPTVSLVPARTPETKHGLLVTLDAKVGKQDQVAAILNNALSIAAREPGTVTWYAYRITETRFGIFDTFLDKNAREAHLNGDIAAILEKVSGDLLDSAPNIQLIDVVASKIQARAN